MEIFCIVGGSKDLASNFNPSRRISIALHLFEEFCKRGRVTPLKNLEKNVKERGVMYVYKSSGRKSLPELRCTMF